MVHIGSFKEDESFREGARIVIVERGDCPNDVIEAGEFSVFHEPEYCARLTVRCKEQCPVAETGIFDIICPREPLRCGLHNGIGGAFGCYLFNLEVPLAIIQDFLAARQVFRRYLIRYILYKRRNRMFTNNRIKSSRMTECYVFVYICVA